MRDFLFSEIAAIERMSNLPDDPKLAIQTGRGLCENLLEPLQATFGRLAIRSAYRSREVNEFGSVQTSTELRLEGILTKPGFANYDGDHSHL
jgi:hypothetical protein